MSIASPTTIKSTIAAAMCICSYSTDSSLRSHLGGGMWHLLRKHTFSHPFTLFISSFLLRFLFHLFFLLVLLDSRSNCRENIWNRPHIFLCSSFTGSSALTSCEYFRYFSRWDEALSPFQNWWKQNEITFLSITPDLRQNIAVLEIIQTSPSYP